MSDTPTENPNPLGVTFLPADAQPIDAAAALAVAEDTLATPTDVAVQLISDADDPPPIGRTLAIDFANQQFAIQAGGHSIIMLSGADSLRAWVEKVVQTERGAHPIHPDDYGKAEHDGPIGDAFGVSLDEEDRIRAALLFHPRIADVKNFQIGRDEINEALLVSFQIVLDSTQTITVDELRVPA